MLRAVPFLLALAALPALASSPYPGEVQTHLSLASQPPESCGLCHLNGVTGTGTVNTPFGKSLRAAGATGGSNIAGLDAALDKLAANGTDSDGDGVSDIAELKAGTNPNVADGTDGGTGGGGGSSTPPPPTFGCGASVVPGLGGVASLLALVLLGVRRRR